MASIIRAGEQPVASPNRGAIAFNYDDVVQRAEAYLNKVKQQAQQILVEARQEADAVREQARVSGMQQAKQEAQAGLRALVNEQVNVLLPAIQSQFEELNKAKDAWLHRWEQDAVKLALRIAERVVASEIERRPEVAADLTREALELLSQAKQVEVQLHPDDHRLLEDHLEQIQAGIGKVASVQFVTNSDVRRGGCVVLSEHGEVDQNIDTRIERISEELLAE